MIRLHTFQPHPSYHPHRHPRFDVMILDHLQELLERERLEHEIVPVLPDPKDRSAISETVIEGVRWGATFRGLIADALVIEDVERDYFVVVDFQDCAIGPGYILSSIPQWEGTFLSMYHRPSVVAHYGPRKAEKVFPGWFCDYAPSLTREYRDAVYETRLGEVDPRLFFSGTVGGTYQADGHNIREAAEVLREKYPDEVDIRWKRAGEEGQGEKLEREAWFLEAARHAVVLALPGHPWCYREHEMFSLGISLLTYRWEAEIFHPWIPEIHFAAVDPPCPRHPMGFPLDPELAADHLIARHRRLLQEREERRQHRADVAQVKFDATNTPCSIAVDILHSCLCRSA